MAFQVSPGVLVTEKDLTNIVPAVSTSIAGVVVVSEKGPMDEITPISSETEYVEKFGKPTSSNFEFYYSATNFLQYGNALRVVRATPANALNATDSGSGALIKNTQDYLDNFSGGSNSKGEWAAREPGAKGNNLKVSLCPNSTAFGPHSMSGNLVNDASAAIGDTTISVDDGSLMQVGDILEFGSATAFTAAPSGFYYKVTNISTNLLTIARYNPSTGETETGGLRHAVVDNAKVLRHWEYFFQFSQPPGTTDDVANAGGSLDEMHIAVVDEDGGITGTANTVLETFEGVSQASDAKDAQGNSNFYSDVIYRESKFIYWMDHDSTLANLGSSKVGQTFDNTGASNAFQVLNTSLTSGADGDTITNAQLATAYEKFLDVENVEINFLIGGPSQTSTDATGDPKATKLIDIAEQRKDCIAFISPARADVVNVTDPIQQTLNVRDFANGLHLVLMQW